LESSAGGEAYRRAAAKTAQSHTGKKSPRKEGRDVGEGAVLEKRGRYGKKTGFVAGGQGEKEIKKVIAKMKSKAKWLRLWKGKKSKKKWTKLYRQESHRRRYGAEGENADGEITSTIENQERNCQEENRKGRERPKTGAKKKVKTDSL